MYVNHPYSLWIAKLNCEGFQGGRIHRRSIVLFSDRQSILHTNDHRQWKSPILTTSVNQSSSLITKHREGLGRDKSYGGRVR